MATNTNASAAKTATNDNTAGSSLSTGINVRIISAAARTPMRIAKPWMLPLTSLASLVTAIRPAIINVKTSITCTPFFNTPSSIRPRTITTNAKMAMAPATAKRVLARFLLPLPASFVAAIKPIMIPPRARIPTAALPISSQVIVAISFAVIARIIMAAAAPRSTLLALSICFLPPANFVEAIKPAITIPRPTTPAPAFPSSSQDIVPIIFIATASIKKAAPIFATIVAALSRFSPAILVTAIRPATTTPKAKIPTAALASSPQDIVPMILAVIANNRKVVPTDFINADIFAIFIADFIGSPPASLLAAIKPAMRPPKASINAPPLARSPHDIPPMIFITAAIMSIHNPN